MARVTVEDCLEQVHNRFALTVLASRRARALSEGRGTALVECDNKEGVTALREIGKSHVRWTEDVEGVMRDFIEEQRSQLRSTTGEHTFLEAASLTGGDGEDGEEEDDVVQELPTDLEKLGTGGDDEEEDDGTSEGVTEQEDDSSDDDDDVPAGDFDDSEIPDGETDDDDDDDDDDSNEADED